MVLHGVDGNFWPLLRLAGQLCLITRAGLEDVLLMPDGSRAQHNAALVRLALENL